MLGLAATLVVVAALIWLIASSPKAEPGTTQQTGGAPSANTQPMQHLDAVVRLVEKYGVSDRRVEDCVKLGLCEEV
ncbi:MAG: hypothetical protein QXN64_08365 [Pyrobaculum sp.]